MAPTPESANTQTIALWRPAWHELDQTLILDLRQKYFFFTSSASDSEKEDTDQPATAPLRFFNGVDPGMDGEVRFAKVIKIEHAVIGELLRVDTFGLDYILYPVGSEEIVIDAEEEPGAIRSGASGIDDWTMQVTLSEISEPLPQSDIV